MQWNLWSVEEKNGRKAESRIYKIDGKPDATAEARLDQVNSSKFMQSPLIWMFRIFLWYFRSSVNWNGKIPGRSLR